MALTDKLTAIANAIRAKTGNTGQLTLDQMVTEIDGISASGTNVMKDYLTARASDGYQFYYYKGTYETLSELLKYGDTSSVTSMNNMFYGCINLTTIPLLDTSTVTNMEGMFYNCQKLTTIPQLNTSKVTSMNSMFNNGSNLTTIPLLDTSAVTNMSGMFSRCSSLTTIPQLDTSAVTNMNSMFSQCSSLTTIPQLDTSKVTNMSSMFYNCSNLTTIPRLDARNVTSMGSTFYGCKALTDCKLCNINTYLQVGSGTSYGHLLTVDSLLFMIGELRNTGSSKTFTVGSANLEKLANVYVKTIAITDEMRAEDEYIDEKLPFEVCESTDEGAMSITTEYATLKNWQIAS